MLLSFVRHTATPGQSGNKPSVYQKVFGWTPEQTVTITTALEYVVVN